MANCILLMKGEIAEMFIRDAFIASLLGIFGYAGAAYANSC